MGPFLNNCEKCFFEPLSITFGSGHIQTLPYNQLAFHSCTVFRAVLGSFGGVIIASRLPRLKMCILGVFLDFLMPWAKIEAPNMQNLISYLHSKFHSNRLSGGSEGLLIRRMVPNDFRGYRKRQVTWNRFAPRVFFKLSL